MEAPLTVEAASNTGTPFVLESLPVGQRFGVVFEDDGETGYFYGLDISRGDEPIVDALHVYSVGHNVLKGAPYHVKIQWSGDFLKALLYFDGRAEAAFDFLHRRAVCRSNLPPANGTFTTTHAWDDAVLPGN